MAKNMNGEDARNLGAYYARKIIRHQDQHAPGFILQYHPPTEDLPPIADLVMHAYALDSTPPVSTEAFHNAFMEGYFQAFRDAEAANAAKVSAARAKEG